MNEPIQMILIVLTLALARSSLTSAADPEPLTLPGDVIIGIVGSVHEKSDETGGCGHVGVRAVEEVGAAEWALQTINNQSHHDYTIGLRVYDACGDEEMALRQTVRLLQDTQTPNPPLLGVVGLGSGKVVTGVATPLHAFRTPILVTEARAAHTIPPADNVFTTAPHLTDQIQAVLSGAVRIGGAGVGVSVVSTCAHASQVLEERAARAGMRVLHVLQLDAGGDSSNSRISNSISDQVTHFITNQVGYGGVIVMLVSVSELNILSSELDGRVLRRAKIRWVLSPLGDQMDNEKLNVEGLRKRFPGSLMVEAHSPVIPGFQKYFKHALFTNSSILTPLAMDYRKAVSQCHSKADQTPSSLWLCDDALTSPTFPPSSTGDDAPATATVKAVSSLAAAFRLVQIERCSAGVHCLEALQQDLHEDVLGALLKLSFTVGGGSDRIRYTADGRLVNTFTISRTSTTGLTQVGVYREDTGVVWNNPGELWGVERMRGREGRTLPLLALQESREEDHLQVDAVLLTHKDYVGRTWAFSVLVVACLGVVSALYVSVYVALRVCDGTLNGPQVLGAVLLMGVMGVYSSCVVYVLPPSPITCAVRQWAPPLCLALCYGVLLVKCMHLRALVSLGLGGEVSQVNLHLSLIFMVGVEGVLCMLGHAGGLGVGEEPLVLLTSDGSRQCGQKRLATLATRVYLILLLIFCVVLGTLNRKIHRNHNEGRWLLLCSCVSCPVVGLWAVMSYLAPPALDPPTTCVALLALASAILALVFIPKMRIISRQAKEFRHKRLAAAASVSTIFSHLEGSAGPLGVASLKDGLKPTLGGESPLHCLPQEDALGSSSGSSVASHQSYRAAFHAAYGFPQPHDSPLATPRHAMKNPIYDSTPGAYP